MKKVIKLPGEGNIISNFTYTSTISNNTLELEINYQKVGKNGATQSKTQNFVLFSNPTHPNLNSIKSTVDQKLTNALGYKKCVIKLYEERDYVYFDSELYAGKRL